MIGVIGGGPAGSYVASLLAKKHDVKVFEEHDSIGLPVQCTGLVTSALNNVIKIRKSFLVNEISSVRIFSPNNDSVDVNFRKKNLVIDRMKFDRHLSEVASDRGAEFYFNHKFTGFTKGKKGIELKFNGNKSFKADKLIGADGPMSIVAKSAGIFGNRKFIIGLQARVSGDFNKDRIDFYLGKKGFGWIVPESYKVARAGVVSYDKPNLYFKNFLRKLGKYKVREYNSGIIPLYDPKAISQKGDVYLVGDAATQVKATTFGGLVPGLICAEELSNAILNNKDYQKLWKNRIGRELYLGLAMRKKLDNFSDKKHNDLVRMFKKDSLRNVIEKNDRDFPSKLLIRLLIKEPRLLKFI